MMDIIDRITKLRLTCDVGTRHFHCGHEYVEIGGAKWATMNVGASSVTDSGLYFQWGDTQGYTADQVGSGEDKKYFGWADYKHCNGTSSILTKYNATDGKTVLDASDDSVIAAWGNGWRMPTTVEFQALGNAVNAVWTTNYQGSGINGLVCIDKNDSNKVLFFPAAGFAYNGRVYCDGSYCRYWSSSLNSDDVNGAYSLYFHRRYAFWRNTYSRCIGYYLRGVLDK